MVLPEFSGSRDEQASALASALEGLYLEEPPMARPSPFPGGRKAALHALADFDVRGYASRRNHVPADLTRVSRLSPYIRHGVLTLREVAVSVRERFGVSIDSVKYWAELGWRAFWRHVYRVLQEAIENDIEEPKVPLRRTTELPAAIAEARTGLVCMDEPLAELVRNGTMHNHARMWVAAWMIHHLGIDWRTGARFFYTHLLDGDPASNSLSWQWVASTFSHKPYFFNRDNVMKYTEGRWCARCTAECPFKGSYDEVAARLFSEGRR
jgi:deoxyribodipyrimidine photo-lyase